MAAFGALVIGASVAAARKLSRFKDALRHVAHETGLPYLRGGLRRAPRVQGRLQGPLDSTSGRHSNSLGVLITSERHEDEHGDSVLWTVVRVSVDGLGQLTSVTPRAGRATRGRDRDPARGGRRGLLASIFGGQSRTPVGAPAFDDQLTVQGADASAGLALFDETGRALALDAFIDAECTLQGDALMWRGGGLVTRESALMDRVTMLTDLGGHWAGAIAQPTQRLGQMVSDDPASGVRLNALRALLAEHRGAQETREAVKRALEHPDPALALLAVESHHQNQNQSGLESWLPRALELAEDTALSDDLRGRAVRCIGPLIDTSEAARAAITRAITRALGSGGDPVISEALAALSGAGRSPDADALIAASRRAGRDSGARLAHHLSAYQGSEVDAALCRLLAVDDLQVNISACEALTMAGGLAAVEALHPMTQGLLSNRRLKSAARHAISAIQDRHGGGVSGALSVADGGDLTMVDDPLATDTP